ILILALLLSIFYRTTVIYIVVFIKLGEFSMRPWDESMFAVNTYEMMHNGKYFSNYFNGHIDICNTKPLLTIWTQIIFVKLFGYNELALRLPSAIAATLVILIIFVFIYKKYSPIWAWISALIILTSSGFISFHTARTAEADSILTLFLLLTNLYFIKFLTEEKKQNILLFFVYLTLAFATKMFASLLFIPAYILLLIINKKLKNFAYSMNFLFGTLLFFIVNFGLILLKNQDNPGYLYEIFNKDAGRMLRVVENHKEIFSYYVDGLIMNRFSVWFTLLMFGFVFVFISKVEKEKKILLMTTILLVSYFLVISISVTKLQWYDMPLFPFMALIAAYPIYFIINWFLNSKPAKSGFKVSLIIISVFAYPYYMMFRQSQENGLNSFEKNNEASERYLFKKNIEHVNLDGIKVFYTGYNGSLLFYKYKMQEMGQNIELVCSENFNDNDKVLVSNDSLKKCIKKDYVNKIIDNNDNADLIQIISKTNLPTH
ncbi:MAG: glycosyltransferase family 39 protein, partial [Bacteroidota bacterium]